MNKEIILEDLLYAINLEWKEGDCHVDFFIHAIAMGDKPEYIDHSASFGPTFTETPNKENSFVSGFLKWDGCINYVYTQQERCMLHECGPASFSRLEKLFHTLYKECAEFAGFTFYLDELKK